MVILKKLFVAITLLTTFSSCTTKEMIRLFNENREQKLELSLETIYDTIYNGENYLNVCMLTLKNTDSKPYYLRLPQWFQHNDYPYPCVFHVEYLNQHCSNCSVYEEEMKHPAMPKYVLLKNRKPQVWYFSPRFSDLTCCGCENNILDGKTMFGEYQIRVYQAIDNDTIYSNPVRIWYLENRQ